MSAAAIAALYAQESSDTLVTLLTIYDADSNEILARLTDNYTQRLEGTDYTTDVDVVYGIVSRGENYVFLPIEVSLPSDEQSGSSKAQLTMRDVTRYLIPLIRSLTAPPKVKLELVLKSQPDTVEIVFNGFYLSSLTYNSEQVTGDLTMIDYQAEPFPVYSFTPSYFPGLF